MSSAALTCSTSNDYFLECHRPLVLKHLREGCTIADVAGVIADYVVKGNIFGPKEWERFFDVQTEDCTLDPEEFYAFWFAQDAELPLLNCDTHLEPCFIPQKIIEKIPRIGQCRFALYAHTTAYNLDTSRRLASAPCEGFPSEVTGDLDIFRQNGQNPAGPPCFVAVRKDVFFRGLSIAQQREAMQNLNARTHAGYEIFPSDVDLCTPIVVQHVKTGDRYLGDDMGMEKRRTESRIANIVKYQVGFPNKMDNVQLSAGYHIASPAAGSRSCLHLLAQNHSSERIGVAGVRKFAAKPLPLQEESEPVRKKARV